MPAWMQQALDKGQVDSVQTLAQSEVIKVNAGDAIGHLSHFIEPAVPPDTREYYYTHLEVFTDDTRLTDFIHNKKGLTGGQQYVKCAVDQPIYGPDFTHPDVFRPMPEAKTEKEFLLPVEEATPRKDYQGNMWYQIDTGEWVKGDGNGVKIVSQHQLDELGFTLIDEVDNDNDAHATFSGKGANMLALMNQLWEEAKRDRLFSRWQMKHDYEQMIKLMKIEQDRFDYKETAFALRKAINNPPMQPIVNKAIIRHQSEWVEDSKSPYWKLFFKAVGSLTDNEYLQQFLDNHIWMKEVPQFSQGQKLWYMHPLVFTETLSDKDEQIITYDMLLAANLGREVSSLKEILPYMNEFARIYKVLDKRAIAHFLSQSAHESDSFTKWEEAKNEHFSLDGARAAWGCHHEYDRYTQECKLGKSDRRENREKLWHDKSNVFVHDTKALFNYVYAGRNGNKDEASGDGYKYRGRGLIQITGRFKYNDFTEIHNQLNRSDIQNFIENPELVSERIKYAVESAFCYFYKNKLFDKQEMDVYKMTLAVNGGELGYSKRLKRFNSVAELLGIEKAIK